MHNDPHDPMFKMFKYTQNLIKWHIRFLELARHVSTWSKDKTKVGAVITDPITHQVVSMGYNGFPRGVTDDDDIYTNPERRDEKLLLTVHAETNAILNSRGSVRGMDIYVFPTMMLPNVCPDCAKNVVQSGIKRVFGYASKGELPERWVKLAGISEQILREGGVEFVSIHELNKSV